MHENKQLSTTKLVLILDMATHHNPKYVVRYVPAGVAERVRGGVGEDDGGLGGGEGVPCRLLGGVRQVHHDPQPVHLLHHRLQYDKIEFGYWTLLVLVIW